MLVAGAAGAAPANVGERAYAAVDPFIGTGGEGHTYPGATVPFGMVQLSPDTRIQPREKAYGWAAGYRYDDSSIVGFSHTHFSGTGHSDLGDVLLMPVTGELRVSGANGDIEIRRAEDSVTATTAHGTLRVGEVARGTVQLETNYGAIDIGVRVGTAAWLDVSSGSGQVRNTLTASESPERTEDTVKVRARTKYGNIDVRRARA
jgi:hypothetical protein